MLGSLTPILITFGWLLCVLSAARTPCGPQRMCVPSSHCREGVSSYSSLCHRSETCCPTSPIISADAPLPCGQSYADGLYGKIEVNANQTRPHEFPWLVALYEDRKFLGGGTLLTENCVLTVAHLLANKTTKSISVRAGAWDLENISPFVEIRFVARIVPHAGFRSSSAAYNMALIVLESSFQTKPHIGFICLPSPRVTIDYQRCLVAGWGKLTYDANRYSSCPKRISLPIVDRATCQSQLRRTRMGRSYELPPSVLCAGGERGRDACQGDGGSPLMCPIAGNPTQYVLAGIVNAGIGCGNQGVPALYTNVTELKPWIDTQLSDDRNTPYKPYPVIDVVI